MYFSSQAICNLMFIIPSSYNRQVRSMLQHFGSGTIDRWWRFKKLGAFHWPSAHVLKRRHLRDVGNVLREMIDCAEVIFDTRRVRNRNTMRTLRVIGSLGCRCKAVIAIGFKANEGKDHSKNRATWKLNCQSSSLLQSQKSRILPHWSVARHASLQ